MGGKEEVDLFYHLWALTEAFLRTGGNTESPRCTTDCALKMIKRQQNRCVELTNKSFVKSYFVWISLACAPVTLDVVSGSKECGSPGREIERHHG